MIQKPAFDSSIPVLTEVVLEPLPLAPESEPVPVSAPVAAPAAAPEAPAAELPPVPVLTARLDAGPDEAVPDAAEPAPPATSAEPGWDALEHRIAERVLAQLQPHIDAVVRNALASAADQIHIGLRQAVEQAVAQQIATAQFR